MRNFILGVLLTLLVLIGGGYLFLKMGMLPVNADASPGAIEVTLANLGRDAAVARASSHEPNPVTRTDESLVKGARLYRENCQGCHGGPDADSHFGLSLYPHAPQFHRHIPGDPDADLFWVAKHGIRLTGMPAFGGSTVPPPLLKDEEIWSTIMFIKNMKNLTPAAQAEFKKS